MPKIRIAALDLDGTLLSHENTITPATRQAIAEAAARGVVVLPATGRALANLPPLVAQLPGVRYAITSNGAAVWVPTRWARSTAAIPTRKRARPASPPALSGGSSRWKRPGRCSGCIRNSRVP